VRVTRIPGRGRARPLFQGNTKTGKGRRGFRDGGDPGCRRGGERMGEEELNEATRRAGLGRLCRTGQDVFVVVQGPANNNAGATPALAAAGVRCIRLVGSRCAVYLSLLGKPAGPLESRRTSLAGLLPVTAPRCGRPAAGRPFRGIT